MLTAHHLSKNYGIQPILKEISFSISTGERIGLVGPNGCGKTTLMRILLGIEKPDQGTVVQTRQNLQIGYLAQGCTFMVLDEPINHLDIPSRIRFEQALTQFSGSILAVVHDRYFIEGFATDMWKVEKGKVERKF